MTASDALGRLQGLGIDAVTTSEAASVLGQSVDGAYRTLGRLHHAGLIRRAAHGVWWLARDPLNVMKLVELLTAPFPAYVSLQTALYAHGMIEQVPVVTYAVTLGRTHRLRTDAGVVSFHHVGPELFGGADRGADGVMLATPEKALVDMAWLSSARSRLFTTPPELQLPHDFRRRAVAHWAARLPAAKAAQLRSAWNRLLNTALAHDAARH